VTSSPGEQRQPYEGSPPRAWLRLRFATPAGMAREWKLIADTGNPLPVVIAQEHLHEFSFGAGTDVDTNFGRLEAAWLQLAMPELGLDVMMIGYGSDAVVAATKISQPEFDGLVGLPLLRLLQYGGDADEFWIRRRT
jgi:hypothetical protein